MAPKAPKRAASPDGNGAAEAVPAKAKTAAVKAKAKPNPVPAKAKMAAVKAKAKPNPVPAKAHGIVDGRQWISTDGRLVPVVVTRGAGIGCRPTNNTWNRWADLGLTEDMKEVISELIKRDMIQGLVNSYGYSEQVMVITYNAHTFISVKWEKREAFCTDTELVYQIIDLFLETVSDWDTVSNGTVIDWDRDRLGP